MYLQYYDCADYHVNEKNIGQIRPCFEGSLEIFGVYIVYNTQEGGTEKLDKEETSEMGMSRNRYRSKERE